MTKELTYSDDQAAAYDAVCTMLKSAGISLEDDLLMPPKGDGLRWANSDPITGQAAWFDLRVKIAKATTPPSESQPAMPPIKSPVGTGPSELKWKSKP